MLPSSASPAASSAAILPSTFSGLRPHAAESPTSALAISHPDAARPCRALLLPEPASLSPPSSRSPSSLSSARLARAPDHLAIGAKDPRTRRPLQAAYSTSALTPAVSLRLESSGATRLVKTPQRHPGCLPSAGREEGLRIEDHDTPSLSTERDGSAGGDKLQGKTGETAGVAEATLRGKTGTSSALETPLRGASLSSSRSASSLVSPSLLSSRSSASLLTSSLASSLLSSAPASSLSLSVDKRAGSKLTQSWGSGNPGEKGHILDALAGSPAANRQSRLDRDAPAVDEGTGSKQTTPTPHASVKAQMPAARETSVAEALRQGKTAEEARTGTAKTRDEAQQESREERKDRLKEEILQLCQRLMHSNTPSKIEKQAEGAAQTTASPRREGQRGDEREGKRESDRDEERTETQGCRTNFESSVSPPRLPSSVSALSFETGSPLSTTQTLATSLASRSSVSCGKDRAGFRKNHGFSLCSLSTLSSFELSDVFASPPKHGSGAPPSLPGCSPAPQKAEEIEPGDAEAESQSTPIHDTPEANDAQSVQPSCALLDPRNSSTSDSFKNTTPTSSSSSSSSSHSFPFPVSSGVNARPLSRSWSSVGSFSLRPPGEPPRRPSTAAHASAFQRTNRLPAQAILPPFPSLPSACPASPPPNLLRLREVQVAGICSQLAQKATNARVSPAAIDQDYAGWLRLPSFSSSLASSVRGEQGEKTEGACKGKERLSVSRAGSSESAAKRSLPSMEEEVYVSRHTLTQSCATQLSMLRDQTGQRVNIQAQLMEQIVAGAMPRQVFEHFFGQGVPVEASVSRFLEKRRMQNTTRRVKEHLEKKVPEFFASKGVPLGTCSPCALFRAAFCYLAQISNAAARKGQNRRRSAETALPTPVLPSSSSSESFASLFTSASFATYLSQSALCDALEKLQWWPKEVNDFDKKEVLLSLALADECAHGKAALARDRLLPQGVTERGWILGFLTLPFNLPDWPVTLDLLPADPGRSSALPFLSAVASPASSRLRCTPYLLVHAPKDCARLDATCFCGFLHLCRVALLICSAFGEKVSEHFPSLLRRLSEKGESPESGPETDRKLATPHKATLREEERGGETEKKLLPCPLEVSAYALSELTLVGPRREKEVRGRLSSRDKEEKKKSKQAMGGAPRHADAGAQEESKASKRKRCKIPAWHLCQDVLLSRLVSLEELQVSLELLCPASWVVAALHFVVGVASRSLSPAEWLALLHPCSPLAAPLEIEELVTRFDLKHPLPSFASSSTSSSSPSFIKTNFLSFFSLASRSSSSFSGDSRVCWSCGEKGVADEERPKTTEDGLPAGEKKPVSAPRRDSGTERSADTQSRLGLQWLSFEKGKGEKNNSRKRGTRFSLPAFARAEDDSAQNREAERAKDDAELGKLSAALPFFSLLSEEDQAVLLEKEKVYRQTRRWLGAFLAECANSETTRKALDRLAVAAVSASAIEPGMPHGGGPALLPLVTAGGSCCFDVYALQACAKVFFAVVTKCNLFSLLHDLL
ncbi:conserved hypothetical protein [Neospora caninum Liverpool]|uniref:Uncharacterized protein n=1 Tax=Neospora caninum (strain Liverpool) TaxID=572307 RepID=F0VDG9_NEOCL|nr:conserved hypothetical protein [Neospora caninum Liverpool]CBZ51762.1 conserved hypothetical protein [Neospora caninum Liverpool]CEL65718.1 TPA: hypothetical protein BN1204_015540 [Neospora caninum Liverpool]|eukprot:XP_003881795.1 conserved hypothetical protein [Neospora caninum Liverpool]